MGRLAGFRYREIVKRLKELGFEFHRQAAGNPTMANLSAIIVAVGRALKVRIEMRVAPI